jgi:hypothetical protein
MVLTSNSDIYVWNGDIRGMVESDIRDCLRIV